MEEEAKKGLGAVGKEAEAIRKIVAILEELESQGEYNGIQMMAVLQAVKFLYLGQELKNLRDWEALDRIMR